MKKESVEFRGVFVKNPLLPPGFKTIGAVITIVGGLAGILSWLELSIVSPWLLSVGWKCFLVLGLALVAMSRETEEDEVLSRLRLEVAQWAVWLLSIITILNIVISDDNPIEAFKVLILVLFGSIVLFRLRLLSFEREK